MAKTEIKTEITGAVWKVLVKPGDLIAQDDPIIILESMKMEIPITVPDGGTVADVLVKEGDAVTEGQTVASWRDENTAINRLEPCDVANEERTVIWGSRRACPGRHSAFAGLAQR